MRFEDGNGDAGDFLISTLGATGDDSAGQGGASWRWTVSYGRGTTNPTNCFGAYDGQNNMCQREGSPGGATAQAGWWFMFVRAR